MPGWCGMVRRDEAVGMATVSEVSLPPLPREKPVVWKRSLGYRGSTGWPLVRSVWVTPVSQFKLIVSASTGDDLNLYFIIKRHLTTHVIASTEISHSAHPRLKSLVCSHDRSCEGCTLRMCFFFFFLFLRRNISVMLGSVVIDTLLSKMHNQKLLYKGQSSVSGCQSCFVRSCMHFAFEIT